MSYFEVIGGPPTALRDADIPTFQTSQSLIGLLGILEQALTASGVQARTSSPVTDVTPGADGIAVTARAAS